MNEFAAISIGTLGMILGIWIVYTISQFINQMHHIRALEKSDFRQTITRLIIGVLLGGGTMAAGVLVEMARQTLYEAQEWTAFNYIASMSCIIFPLVFALGGIFFLTCVTRMQYNYETRNE